MSERAPVPLALPPVTDEVIEGIARCIVEQFHPEKVILFGSRAWGVPQEDSDVDILVIMQGQGPSLARGLRVRQACRPRRVAMDLLVKTPAEIEHRLEIGDPFIRRVLEEGRLLYAR